MRLKRTHFLVFLAAIMLVIYSCSKQKSPSMAPEEIRSSREIERLDACSKVNFNKGVLLYKNVLDLFVCTKWDEQFPHMFSSIKTISADSWDHLMAPIDQAFVENQTRRDRIFKNIRELDSKGGLDDLSYVIVALNETNFFDSTKALFTCVDNKLDPLCQDRSGRVPTKSSLQNIIKVVDSGPEHIEKLSLVLKSLVTALNGQEENIRTEINKFRASPAYVPARLALVDALAKKAKSGLSSEDREFLPKVLLTGNSTGDVPWIYQWLQDAKMNRQKFRDLIEYPVLANPEFLGEIRALEKAYDNGLSCSIKSTSSPNELIEFVFKAHVSDYVSVIKNESYKSFYDHSSAGIFGLKMSTEVCRELETNKYNLNFIGMLTHFSDFLGEKKFYDLTKFLLRHSTATGDLNKSFAENLYLFDLLAGNLFSSANSLNSNIISSTREFYPLVFDVAKNLPPETFTGLGEVLGASFEKENDPRFKGIADFWLFFTPEEKNFIFNFLDRHFDKDVKYVLLFDFYTKFLDDLKEVQPLFKDNWMGTAEKEEMSYLTLKELLSKLAGKETLLDFKKFFSRDQILKVLEVISNGQKINKLAAQELKYIYSDNYIAQSRSEKYIFKVTYDAGPDSDYNSKVLVDCMRTFNDIHNGFYELVRRLPSACEKISNENIAFRVYGWINAIEENYLAYKKPDNSEDSLLDRSGILSPYMLNSTLGLAKVLDSVMGPVGSSEPTKNGLNYVLSSLDYHLNQKGAAALIERDLEWLNRFLNVAPEKNLQHRNALLKSFSREDNFAESKNVFKNIARLTMDYGDWVKSGDYQRAKSRSLGTYDPKYDCEKMVNQFISPYPCPDREVVKLYGNELLFLLQNKFEEANGSPVAKIMMAAMPGEGIVIPPSGRKSKKYRLSLKETFRFFYDASDKSLDINNREVKFTNEAGKTSIEKVTTLERIESVIREVRFGNNYLGVQYLNAVVFGNDYNSDVRARKALLSKCVRIPYFRCGRRMSDNDLRMAINSLAVYDGLYDANNYSTGETKLNYGDFLKAFQTTLVTSSATDAQRLQFFPLEDAALVKHNGKVLTDMTVLTSWSNAARIIRDRVGRTRKDFEKFVESEDFKRVDRALLYGFELPAASSAAERLLKKLNNVPGGERQNLFGHTVDWVANLSYEETRLFEDTIARLMVVGSYLGTPQVVFQKEGHDVLAQKYANNNLYQVFLALDKIIDYWPTLKNYFPADAKLVDALRPLNTALYFLTDKLSASSEPDKNMAYLALNDLFLVLQTSLFDEVSTPAIGASPDNKTRGLDLLIESFKDPSLVARTYSMVRENVAQMDVFHQNQGESFRSLGQNIYRMASSSKVDLVPLRDYISFTTKNAICQSSTGKCAPNYHYDEIANLVGFLNKKTETGQSYFMLMNQRFFVQNIEQINQMLDYLLPAIAIKEVRPPLAFN